MRPSELLAPLGAAVCAGLFASHVEAATPSLSFTNPAAWAVAADDASLSPGYRSPTPGTNITVLNGSGGSLQVVQVTTDRGGLVLGSNQACPSSARTVLTATAATSIGLTFCASAIDPPGTATLTAQNLLSPDVTATATIVMARRPANIAATLNGRTFRAVVTDASGNVVADGTPVRYTVAQGSTVSAGACATTTNGTVTLNLSSYEGLAVSASGVVTVAAEWNATGDAATCASPGVQWVLSTASGPEAPVPVVPAGQVSSGSIPRNGGFGLIVYGGAVSYLATAANCPSTSSSVAFWATIDGMFVTYVPAARIAAVSAAFMAAFPTGTIPAGTPLVGRCQ